MDENYYKTKESVEEYIRLAKDVNGQQLIEKLKKFLPSDASLLEIGSGPGTDFQILKQDYNVIGSDYSDAFLSRLISSHANDEFLKLDAITLATEKKFNGIYSNKVLHHLKDHELKSSIKRQAEILHPNGIICHSFWEGEDSEIFKGLYVNYHTKSALRKLFGNFFDILLIEQYAEFEAGDSILLIGKTEK